MNPIANALYQTNPFSKPAGDCHGDEGTKDVDPKEEKAEALERREKMIEKRSPEDAQAITEQSLVIDSIDALIWELAKRDEETLNCDDVMERLLELRARVNDQINELCGLDD